MSAQRGWDSQPEDGESKDRASEFKLLVVEDNPGDVRLLGEALRAARVSPRVDVVRDGAEAVGYLRRSGPYAEAPRPDLIVLDLNLPKVSGKEVLQVIKSDPDLRRIPVMVWTTSRSELDIASAYELHANCYVTKPVGLDEFFKLIDSAQRFWFRVATLPPR